MIDEIHLKLLYNLTWNWFFSDRFV